MILQKQGTKIKVKLSITAPQIVEATANLRQRDAFPTVVVNLILKKKVREMNLCEGVTVSRSTIGILTYVGDITSLERKREIIVQMRGKLIKAIVKVGFNINGKKTKYIIVVRINVNRVLEVVIEVEDYWFKRVDPFGYLGSIDYNPR